jgi:hypothetical protein
MLAESFIHTMSVVVCRRTAFRRHGLLDETLRIVHDLDWYRRPLAAGEPFAHLARPLVERGVPGGLLRATPEWFREERAVLAGAFAADAGGRDQVLATRSLFFARVALSRGDVAFALARIAEALICSPRWAVEVAARRLVRRAARLTGSGGTEMVTA